MRRQTLVSFALTLAALLAGLALGGTLTHAAWAAGKDPYARLETFARVLAQIRTHYVEEVDEDRLMAAALRGLSDELDEQSVWFTPEEWAAIQADKDGNTGGIGAVVSTDGAAGLLVEEVLPRSPAELAGLQAGDHIVQIDGQPALGLTLTEALHRLRGERGTSVTLTLARDGQDRPLVVTLVRDEVIAPSARGQWINRELVYLRIEQFRYGCAAQVRMELDRVSREQLTRAEGLILDLRENPGGLLNEAVGVLDLFLGDAVAVRVKGREGRSPEEVYSTTTDAEDLELPMVVLVNERSASASEVVAGVLQAYARATVIGAPTFGKGSVQTHFEYPDRSAMALTIARYELPSGRVLSRGDGLVPDQEVLLPLVGDDPAVALREALRQAPLPSAERSRLLELAAQLPESEGRERLAPPLAGPMSQRLKADPQLAAAVAHLTKPPL